MKNKTKAAQLWVIFSLLMIPMSVNAETEVCNCGDSWVYMATMGTSDGISNAGIIEGFKPIQPGYCAPLFPYGISRVYVSFFKYDKRGVLNNVAIVPAEQKNRRPKEEIVTSCLPPQEAFRFNGTWSEIKQKFTPPCPSGFIPAENSMEVIDGTGKTTMNLRHTDDEAEPAWGPEYGPKRKLQSIWDGTEGSGMLEPNEIHERDLKLVAGLLDAAGKAWKEAEKKEAERRARQLEIYRQRQAAYQRKVEEAKKQLERPEDDICNEYLSKASYEDFEEAAIAGIKPGMDTNSALNALLCNGFTTLPQTVAKFGSVENYMNRGGVVRFRKMGPQGYVQELELENRGQGKSRNNTYSVLSVRLRFRADHIIDGEEWASIKKDFLNQYKVGGLFSGVKKIDQEKFVHYQYRKNKSSHTLQLNQENSYNRPLNSYTITLL